jgi:hypothetical protein
MGEISYDSTNLLPPLGRLHVFSESGWQPGSKGRHYRRRDSQQETQRAPLFLFKAISEHKYALGSREDKDKSPFTQQMRFLPHSSSKNQTHAIPVATGLGAAKI